MGALEPSPPAQVGRRGSPAGSAVGGQARRGHVPEPQGRRGRASRGAGEVFHVDARGSQGDAGTDRVGRDRDGRGRSEGEERLASKESCGKRRGLRPMKTARQVVKSKILGQGGGCHCNRRALYPGIACAVRTAAGPQLDRNRTAGLVIASGPQQDSNPSSFFQFGFRRLADGWKCGPEIYSKI
ncbi:hypothetical protein THAOC_06166 [Thalassiosira oceanica]|uniref:Uncharacterized protein n=1 Tax=Thalassiosira oceanica TaxID=159749 RepID=K0T115_THAOC|nr:hypothetical protein THAOC_06166 [Thalassiosira oceanica]|eukprot:EJK72313.1 hypothetical protein THAOC_06166 [Thalassiosira oceanica]